VAIFDHRQDLVPKGRDLVEKGGDLVRKGGDLVRKGGDLVRKGGDLVRKGRDLVPKGGDLVPKGGDLVRKGRDLVEGRKMPSQRLEWVKKRSLGQKNPSGPRFCPRFHPNRPQRPRQQARRVPPGIRVGRKPPRAPDGATPMPAAARGDARPTESGVRAIGPLPGYGRPSQPRI